MDVCDEVEGEGGESEAEGDQRLAVQVSTVDAFQGGEKEVIIVTTSRTERRGFTDDAHRLNVALTRARRHLLVIGKAQTLRGSPLWHAVIEHARLHRGFLSAPQFLAHRSFASAGTEQALNIDMQ